MYRKSKWPITFCSHKNCFALNVPRKGLCIRDTGRVKSFVSKTESPAEIRAYKWSVLLTVCQILYVFLGRILNFILILSVSIWTPLVIDTPRNSPPSSNEDLFAWVVRMIDRMLSFKLGRLCTLQRPLLRMAPFLTTCSRFSTFSKMSSNSGTTSAALNGTMVPVSTSLHAAMSKRKWITLCVSYLLKAFVRNF